VIRRNNISRIGYFILEYCKDTISCFIFLPIFPLLLLIDRPVYIGCAIASQGVSNISVFNKIWEGGSFWEFGVI
jgi:hypothetical protein